MTPDLDKHAKLVVGDLVLKLAMAHAQIEMLEKSLAEAQASRGTPDGAQGADGPEKEGAHG